MKQVNIIVGRFQPLTYGHMKCVEEAWNKLNIPTIIAMIETKEEKVDQRHPFPSTLLMELYNEVFKKSQKIEKIILVRNANIVEIGENLYAEGYEIRSWTAGTDRIDSYTKMTNKYHELAHLATNFEMIEVKRSDEDVSATKARQALIDNDEKEFAKLTPLISLKSRLQGNNIFMKLKNQLLSVIS